MNLALLSLAYIHFYNTRIKYTGTFLIHFLITFSNFLFSFKHFVSDPLDKMNIILMWVLCVTTFSYSLAEPSNYIEAVCKGLPRSFDCSGYHSNCICEKFNLIMSDANCIKFECKDVKKNINETGFSAVFNTKLTVSAPKLAVINSLGFYYCPMDNSELFIREFMKYFSVGQLESFEFSGSPTQGRVLQMKELTSVERLFLSNNTLTTIPDQYFDNFIKLKTLSLKRNGLTVFKIKSNVLTKLNLERNNLSTVADVNAPQLKTLHIQGNNIHNVNFNHLKSLEIIDFSENAITQLQKGVFSDLKNLEKISMNNNGITVIKSGAFDGLLHLKYLYIENNKEIIVFESNCFSIPSLNYLSLSGSNMTKLKNGIFSGNTNLKTLVLSFNRITALDGFDGLETLETLDLTRNLLEDFPEHNQLASLKKLKVLILSKNKMTEIKNGYFYNMKSLEELFLDGNQLENISFIDTKLPKIQKLDLSNNLIKIGLDLPAFPFHRMRTLGTLNLSNNEIAYFTNMYRDEFTSPINLDLSGNKITEINVANLRFADSSKINFSRNRIVSVDTFVMHHHTFGIANVSINLSKNPVNCGCNILDLARLIHKHYFNRNKIALNVENLVCDGPKKLAKINLEKVNEKDLVCNCQEFVSTSKINVTNNFNCITRPHDYTLILDYHGTNMTSLPHLPSLDTIKNGSLWRIDLNVQDNAIDRLEVPDHVNYKMVRRIFAQNNAIKTIDLSSKSVYYLSELNLDGNLIQNIDMKDIKVISKGNISVSLNHNAFECNCNMVDLFSFVANTLPNRSNITCKDGRTFDMLDTNILCERQRKIIIASSLSLVVIILMISSLAIAYYKFKLELEILIHYYKRKFDQNYRELSERPITYDAFLSFAEEDSEFVAKEILGILESPPYSLKICSTHRDFNMEEDRVGQITKFVNESNRTIIIMSSNYLRSCWNRLEFRTAHCNAFEDNRSPVIIILYEKIRDTKDLDPPMKAYITTRTYLKYNSMFFWKRLLYVISRRRDGGRRLDEDVIV